MNKRFKGILEGMDKKEIEKLAELSKIDLSEDEKEEFSREIDSILSYVSEIQKAAGEVSAPELPLHHNALREDVNPYTPGAFTEDILEDAPKTQDGYIKVKKIL
jgi:aspartyl-tRNA(Asn)/glutamyl-tRNA(Gln) amidotransferase subunit C